MKLFWIYFLILNVNVKRWKGDVRIARQGRAKFKSLAENFSSTFEDEQKVKEINLTKYRKQ